MRASVSTGSTSMCGSSSMIEVCWDDAIARPAGTATTAVARTRAPKSTLRRRRNYLTVTLTVRLYTVSPATGAVMLADGSWLVVG
jgi:hypothetical protein